MIQYIYHKKCYYYYHSNYISRELAKDIPYANNLALPLEIQIGNNINNFEKLIIYK
jgi:hypothetical protein